MKLLISLMFAWMVALTVAHPDDNHYDAKYDNLNVDEIIENKRLIKAYALCFLGEGKCTPEGNDIKKWIPEATKNNCAKCTDKQKALAVKMIKGMQEKCPEEWEKLYKQSDPTGEHKEEFNAFLASH